MHPILFQFGPVKVYSFGVMVMLGFLAAAWWASRSGARRGISSDAVMDAAVYIFIPAMIFARLMFVVLNLADYHSLAEVGMVWKGGMSFHGGLLGGTLGGLLFCHVRRISAWEMADIIAPGVALGYAIGRVGCLLNGCCYGAACHLPWAMRFPDIENPGSLTPPSHPTMIYSSIAGLLMFLILARLDGRRKYPGHVFIGFLCLYSVYRYIIEFFRAGVTGKLAFGGQTQAQIASLAIIVAALAIGRIRFLAFRKASDKGLESS